MADQRAETVVMMIMVKGVVREVMVMRNPDNAISDACCLN